MNKKETKKHAAAPSRQAPNPSSLQIRASGHQYPASSQKTHTRTSPTATTQNMPPPHSIARSNAVGYTHSRQLRCKIERTGCLTMMTTAAGPGSALAVSRLCFHGPIGIGRGWLGNSALLLRTCCVDYLVSSKVSVSIIGIFALLNDEEVLDFLDQLRDHADVRVVGQAEKASDPVLTVHAKLSHLPDARVH